MKKVFDWHEKIRWEYRLVTRPTWLQWRHLVENAERSVVHCLRCYMLHVCNWYLHRAQKIQQTVLLLQDVYAY